MAYNKIIRTLLVEIPSVPGSLGKAAMAIGLCGGDIGEVETIKVGPAYTHRNITVQIEQEEELGEIIESINTLEGFRVQAVSDEVLCAHEGGKVQMKSRMPIETLADLSRVYTPGVEDVCKVI